MKTPIINVRDNENDRCKRNAKKAKTVKKKENGSYRERVRAKWFCRAFKLGFLPLLCKAPLVFKSNLELALSIILKERVVVECRCLKIWDLLWFLMFLNPSSKMMTSFSNTASTTASTSKFIYYGKLQIIMSWILTWKIIC